MWWQLLKFQANLRINRQEYTYFAVTLIIDSAHPKHVLRRSILESLALEYANCTNAYEPSS